jgi:hypothetical protein
VNNLVVSAPSALNVQIVCVVMIVFMSGSQFASMRQLRRRRRAIQADAELQLQVQTEGLVDLRHDLRRKPTQDWSDAFDSHRTHLLGLSL